MSILFYLKLVNGKVMCLYILTNEGHKFTLCWAIPQNLLYHSIYRHFIMPSYMLNKQRTVNRTNQEAKSEKKVSLEEEQVEFNARLS